MLGHAYRFTIVLPLQSAEGEGVFSDYDLLAIHELLDRRCGGLLGSSSVTHPPWYGSYLPEQGGDPVRDLHTVIQVYTRQVDAADHFFGVLKTRLKKAGDQDEILIERAAVWLVEAVPLPRHRGE